MKTKFSIILSSLGLALSIGAGLSAINKNKSVEPVNAATYTQSVNEYYASINWNQTGSTLKQSLFEKIKITTSGWTYDGLWEAYKKTDVRPDGKHYWDIYSDTNMFTLNDSRINEDYKKEGDSINREHIIPQGSFNKASPMKSDVHHVLPSDGYVNNRRSSHPHGIVTGSPTYTSIDGCKLGTGTGSTTVFEPMDQYKGDIARIYFYFVTCYQDKLSSNSFSAFDKSTFPSIKTAFLNVYLQWAKDDPVSEKEIIRNNEAYAGQGNRNPFIDCPYAVGAIWDSDHASDYGKKGEYTSGTGVSVSKSTVNLISGGTTTISASATDSSNVTWTTSNSSVVSLSSGSSSSGSNITLTAGSAGTATITATATISGKEYSKTCAVKVSATKQVTSISISDQKTSYSVDDTFVTPTVTARYNDDTEATVTSDATCSGYNMSVAGEYTVTVTYNYGGASASTTYSIKVKSTGGGGQSGETISLDIDFTGSKSSDTDSEGNVWTATGSITTGSGYLRLNSTASYISNSPALSVDTGETMSFSATLRTYGGVSSQSLRVTAYNEDDDTISNTLVLTPTSSTLTEYSGTLTFTNSIDHEVIIKAYSGNDKSLGISGMSISYTSWEEGTVVHELEEISISTKPNTDYVEGETFNPTGLVITRIYDNDTSDTYSYAGHTSEFTFNPSLSTPLTAYDEDIEITYGGQSCFLQIEVSLPKELSSISISGFKTSFVEGDAFSFGGTVTAHYVDETSENVTESAEFSGYDMTTVGNYTVVVTYGGEAKSYQITVSIGTLSSIAVSGQTTTYVKNGVFGFDGTCTATFANGYQKAVTPTSVTSPDMTTGGNKTITVSYTYNGVTKTTNYSITVNAYRTVMESQVESVLLTWVSNSNPTVTPSSKGITGTKSGNTYYDGETNGFRLGTGSNGGQLTISSSTYTLKSLTINAKYYSSDSSAVLNVDGTSVGTLTNSFKDFYVDVSGTNTVLSSLNQSNRRVNIKQVTVYFYGAETDIGQSEDCVGLETFINNYMHMDYTENLGYCKDNEHHYYSTAKAAFNDLNEHQRSLFTSNSAYLNEWDRLSTWAEKNGDSLNSSNLLAVNPNIVSYNSNNNNSSTLIIVVVALASISSICILLIIKKRKTIH